MKPELSALIRLLEDPDPEIFRNLSPRILSQGLSAIDELENACKSAGTKEHLYRLEHLIAEIRFNEAKYNLGIWIDSGAMDLQLGFNVIDELIHPDGIQEVKNKIFSEIRNEVWLELNRNLTALEKIRVLNLFFFEKHKIQTDTKNPGHPVRYTLARLASDRLGNNESILAAYTIIARGLELPLYGVMVPGLSLLAYLDLPFTPKPGFDPSTAPILFFIHPGEKGRIFGIEEVRFFLSKFYPDLVSQPVISCTDSILLKNHINSVAKSAKRSGKVDLENKLRDLLTLWE